MSFTTLSRSFPLLVNISSTFATVPIQVIPPTRSFLSPVGRQGGRGAPSNDVSRPPLHRLQRLGPVEPRPTNIPYVRPPGLPPEVPPPVPQSIPLLNVVRPEIESFRSLLVPPRVVRTVVGHLDTVRLLALRVQRKVSVKTGLLKSGRQDVGAEGLKMTKRSRPV